MTGTIDDLLRSSGLPRSESAHPPGGVGPNADVRRFYLHAGQLYAAGEPTEIVTILGSCVAVCLFDAARAIGGVNHFMLPGAGPTPSPRYAKDAVELLLSQLVALGARRNRLEAKLFGGASVLKLGTDSGRDLGARNIEAARLKLAEERIPVVNEDVGGNRGRKLLFSTGDGTALVKQV
jgi:chemotaxis protein CheD